VKEDQRLVMLRNYLVPGTAVCKSIRIAFVGHGHSNSFDRMIALEPFRRSASGRNKLPTYTHSAGPAKTLPPRGAGWEPERQAFQS